MKYYQLIKLTFKNKYEYLFTVVFNLKDENNYTAFEKILYC